MPEESRPERILVLYGSHLGTSEEVARSMAEQMAERLSTAEINVHAKGPIALDDFLEEPAWEPLVVIVVSSFGLGSAPRNARKFRRLCDQWSEQFSENSTDKEASEDSTGDKNVQLPLTGLHFALLGLGSSSYRSYQANPIAVRQGLLAAGATLVGDPGAADAAAGDGPQKQQIQEWKDSLWSPMAQAVEQFVAKPLSMDRLREMNKNTVLV